MRWRPLGTPVDTHKETNDALLAAMRAPSITIQVVTADAPTRRAPMCAFLISEFRADTDEPTIVQVELPPVEMTFGGVEDVRAFEAAWDQMVEAALSPRESTKFVAELMRI